MKRDLATLIGQEEIVFVTSSNYENFYKNYNRICSEPDGLRDSMWGDWPHFIGPYKTAIFNFTKVISPRLIVELGVREGYSSDSMIRAASQTGGKLVSFDPNLDQIQTYIFMPSYQDYWTTHRLTGEEGHEQFGRDLINIDLLYIDTDPHTYEQTTMWFNEYWINNVRPGGYIMLDDCDPKNQRSVMSPEGGDLGWEVLEPTLDFIENNDRIDFAFSVSNMESTGILIIKLKE